MDTLDYEKAKDFVLSRYPDAQCGFFGYTSAYDKYALPMYSIVFSLSFLSGQIRHYGHSQPEAWIKAAEYIVENG